MILLTPFLKAEHALAILFAASVRYEGKLHIHLFSVHLVAQVVASFRMLISSSESVRKAPGARVGSSRSALMEVRRR